MQHKLQIATWLTAICNKVVTPIVTTRLVNYHLQHGETKIKKDNQILTSFALFNSG
jgi:hypothetical protein